MSTTLAQVNALVDARIQDTPGKLGSDDIDACTTTAAAYHSRYRPRTVFQEYTAGSNTDTFALPTSWDVSTSALVSIENPTGNVPQTFRDPNDYTIAYDVDNDAERIRFVSDIANADTFVAEYTAPHDVTTASTFTVADGDREALADLAAHFACTRLQAFYADTSDSGLDAGAVDTEGLGARYEALATLYLNNYERFMGIATSPGASAGGDGSSDTAAFAVKDFDPLTSWGRRRIFHSGSAV